MKVIIAGGGGFIGSVIASICGSHGLDPVILDTLSESQFGLFSDYPYYEGEITDALLVDRIFREHPDIFALFDCSELAGYAGSADRPVTQRPGGFVGGIQFIGYVVHNGNAQLLSGPIYQIATEFAVSDQPPASRAAPRPRKPRTCLEVTRAEAAGGSSRCAGSESATTAHNHAQQYRSTGWCTPSSG
ncbi:UDP-glucose 4-epimerase [Kitasatospora sp. MAP12-15]|uniref:NAD-dependent epimerase/dehydratase family protein n=1 Tax=unclassified Kitasatospora TaxID=2633591 RepID=UPI0024739AD1|nr:NAD-dependent epimerase/dehydratase family protein [Kitasatospora sp. MAP12-44]MDH6107800.1 UDP-glucose 4-epimerase [Kitasatospora sp. MAP12-44]